ncbi:hypothetical protein BDN72DRAFT_500026 [Pluteus cervinus]|uniref:Uncharacterized protein n=1 Tax=Pluteus cervinus TaxID=181527 RepID=A0ACD3AY05_9AGAR|nr:hypothetical protein BDN72DRAFT_500026 [Pluteus cervinus]
MDRYAQDYPVTDTDPAAPADTARTHAPTDRLDERSSPSSEEGLSKVDTENDDDPNSSLTSQTLNADGTPKRPMNAFMIFARRRRPQVSSENSSLRTGDISKILSKEWNAMLTSDKQFYLDQAKQLKETFNTKYPDYIYKRRPNNSRKRRKPDTAATGSLPRSHDHSLPSDPGDDLAPPGDVGNNGLADSGSGDGHPDFPSSDSHHYSRIPHEVSHGYEPPSRYNNSQSQRTPNYPYPPPSDTYRSNPPPPGPSTHDHRLPYPSSTDRYSHDVSTSPITSSSRVLTQSQSAATAPYPYIPSQAHSQTSVYGTAEPNDSGGHSTWDRSDNARSTGWLPQDRGPLAPLGVQRSGSYSPSSHQPPSWTNPPPSSAPTSATSTTPSSSFSFPTLTSPFYPTPAQIQSNYPSSSTTSQSSSPGPYGNSSTPHLPPPHSSQPPLSVSLPSQGGGGGGGGGGRGDYDDRRYSSPSTSISSYPTTTTTSSSSSTGGGGINGTTTTNGYRSTLPRGLPPLQSALTGYPPTNHHHHHHHNSHSLHASSPSTRQGTAYWSDKVDGL